MSARKKNQIVLFFCGVSMGLLGFWFFVANRNSAKKMSAIDQQLLQAADRGDLEEEQKALKAGANTGS